MPAIAASVFDRSESGADRLPRVLRVARLLDGSIRVPGTTLTFGVDPLIGLVPGLGDVVSLGLGSVIVIEAARLGCRRGVLARMVANLVVDALVGAVPVLGDAADFLIKPNAANAKLLEEEHRAGRLRRYPAGR